MKGIIPFSQTQKRKSLIPDILVACFIFLIWIIRKSGTGLTALCVTLLGNSRNKESAMRSPPEMAEIASIKAEIENLRSALDTCTDSRIREVIEFRIEERRLKLAQYESPRASKKPSLDSAYIRHLRNHP